MSDLPARSPAAAAVIVMGVSGSGKSTLGALLAESLGCVFLEGDAFHSAEAVVKMRDRWPWLDRIGSAAAASIDTCGVSVAACSALRRVYRDRLRSEIPGPVQFVLLEAERAQLLTRMSLRPGHFMPTSLLDSQLETLERPQPDEGVLILPANLPPATLRDRVLAYLEQPALKA
jgi:gluconokinase